MADSYDDLPYRSVPHPDTHPAHLATIGRLLGVAAPDPYRCRVLELGCASGGNLIPIAWYLPETECVGIERSARQAEAGSALIATLGLRNCRLLAMDLLDAGPELGPFDYIVAHGVFSWVPDAVRARMLDLCRELLAPSGIVFLSFNALPGWRLRGALREMLLAQCRGVAGAAARLARARELLALLAYAQRGAADPAARYLQQEVHYLLRAHPSYLYHEYLEDTNEPLWFRDFAALAQAHGLQYLADAELATMFPSTLGSAAEEALAGVEDQLELEQLIDFVRLRNFRRALLCHAERPLSREIALADVEALAFYADLPASSPVAVADDAPQSINLPGGASATVEHPLAKAALACLSEHFPASVGFAALAAEAAARVRAAGAVERASETAALAAELFSLFANGVVRAEPAPRSLAPAATGLPRLNALCRAQAGQGHIPTPRHQALDLDAFATRLAGLLDGTRDLPALTEALRRAADPGASAGLAAASAVAVEANIERLLALFRHHGVLDG